MIWKLLVCTLEDTRTVGLAAVLVYHNQVRYVVFAARVYYLQRCVPSAVYALYIKDFLVSHAVREAEAHGEVELLVHI